MGHFVVQINYRVLATETRESAQFLVPLTNPATADGLEPIQQDIRSSSNSLSPHGVLWGDLTNPRFAREGRNVDDGIPDELYERMIYLASQLMDSYLRYDSLYVGIRISYPQFGEECNNNVILISEPETFIL